MVNMRENYAAEIYESRKLDQRPDGGVWAGGGSRDVFL